MSEEVEEIEEELIEEEPEKEDPRLKKMVEMLIKQTGIEASKLKGKSLEEQFDLLSFYQDNLPKKKENTKVGPNKPIVGKPVHKKIPKIGRIIQKTQTSETRAYDPRQIFSGKAKEIIDKFREETNYGYYTR